MFSLSLSKRSHTVQIPAEEFVCLCVGVIHKQKRLSDSALNMRKHTNTHIHTSHKGKPPGDTGNCCHTQS